MKEVLLKNGEYASNHGINKGDKVVPTAIGEKYGATKGLSEAPWDVAEIMVDSVRILDSNNTSRWFHYTEVEKAFTAKETTRPEPGPGKEDPVNHPSHYNAGAIEVLEVIEDQGWGEHFCKGNVLKYTMRAGRKYKGKEVEDLQKADFYLRRAIELKKAEQENRKPCRPNEMKQ
jgi:hypothetical protein